MVTNDQERSTPVSTAELLAAAGITVTEEGKARAGQRLAEAEARMTPEKWDANRAQLDMPPKASAA